MRRAGSALHPLAGACLATIAWTAGFQGCQATTLAEAVALADQTNPSLLAQRQRLRSLDEGYVQARAPLGPQVNLSAEVDHDQAVVDQPASLFGPASTSHLHARTDAEALYLSQILLDGGRSASAIGAAEADILAGREQLRSAEIQLVQQVVAVFIGVRRDQQFLDIARGALELLLKEDKDTELRFKVHEVTRTDQAQAKARLDAARAAVAVVQARLQISQTQYLQVVGQNPDQLEEPLPLAGLPQSLDAAIDTAEVFNPAVRASKFTERGSQARIAQARSSGNATLSAQFAVTNAPEESYDSRFYQTGASARLVLSKPIYTSGMIGSRVRDAIDRNTADRLQIEVARRQAVQQVGQAWIGIEASDAVLKLDEQQVEAQLIAYDSVRAELKAGLRTTIEVLNAEQELQGARQSVVQGKSDNYIARAALLAAMGVLDPEAVSPGLDPYSPKRAFEAVRNKGLPPGIGVIEYLNQVGIHGRAKGAGASDVDSPRPDLEKSRSAVSGHDTDGAAPH